MAGELEGNDLFDRGYKEFRRKLPQMDQSKVNNRFGKLPCMRGSARKPSLVIQPQVRMKPRIPSGISTPIPNLGVIVFDWLPFIPIATGEWP